MYVFHIVGLVGERKGIQMIYFKACGSYQLTYDFCESE